MNERIKELIEQSGMTLKARQPYDEENYPGYECSDNDHFDDNLESVRAFFDGGIEKFAELIVRECILAVRQNYVDYGTTAAVIAIENRFGVEE